MPDDPLWKIIQSLTKSEKRYFKLYANLQTGGKPRNYMRIFDLLAEQKTYDKQALKKEFAGEKILERLSSEKDYLFRTILKSMRAFHASKSVHAKIRGWMQDAIFLYNKSVYTASARLFRKARMKATEMEDHLALIEILRWESKLVKLTHKKKLEPELARIMEHGKLAARQLVHTQDLHQLYNQFILTVYQANQARAPELKMQLKAILDAQELTTEPTGFEGLHFYLQLHSLYHQLSGDYESAYGYQTRLIDHWQKHRIQAYASPTRYKQLLSNTVQLCLNTKRLAEIPELLSRIRKYPSESVHDEIQVKQITLFDELLYYLNVGDFDSLPKLVPEIESWLLQYGNVINESRKIAFQCNLAFYYFLTGELKRGLEWTHRIMDACKGTQRIDIQYFSRIMHLLLHFELGNLELLEYLTRSTYRYLYRKGALHEFEKAILTYVQQLLELPGPAEKRAIFEKMALELSTLAKDPVVSEAPGVAETLIWVNSKCKGITIREQFALQTHP